MRGTGFFKVWKSGRCCFSFDSGSGFQPLLQRVEFVGEALGKACAELGEVFADGGDFGEPSGFVQAQRRPPLTLEIIPPAIGLC